MSINIYWTMLENEWMRAKKPVSIETRFFEKKPHTKRNKNASTAYCPSIKNSLKNLYGLESIYDYEFFIDKDNVIANNYDQNFFNDHVIIRDINQKFFSFKQKYLFFTEEDSLNMTTYLYPFLENNYVANNCFSLPAGYDIGKWFRNIEFPFFLKDESNSFKINRGDIYSYIKFDTDKKINFIQFYPTEKIQFFVNSSINSSVNKKRIDNLDFYYSLFKKNKKQVIKEIKNNILDDV